MRALSIRLFLPPPPTEWCPCVPQEKGGLAPTGAGLAATLKDMLSKLLDIVGTLLGNTAGSSDGGGGGDSSGGGGPKTRKKRANKTQGGGFKEAFEAKYGTRYVSLLFYTMESFFVCVCVFM